MAEAATKLPVKTEKAAERPAAPDVWRPFETLRREIDRLFDDFDRSWVPFKRWRLDWEPFARRDAIWDAAPVVDIVEREKEYEITAELPGIDASEVEVKLSNGALTIKGEKKEEKETKDRDVHRRERAYGYFRRSIELPADVDADKITATYRKGVLTIDLPKTKQAQDQAKRIEVKAA